MMTSDPNCMACSRIVALARLAGRLAFVGRLDAVIDRVADEVEERVGQAVEHTAVELGIAAPDLPVDHLAEGPRQIAHGPVELVGGRGDRHHAGPHGAFLEVVEHSGQLGELGYGGRLDLEARRQHAADSQMGGSRLADQADQLVETFDRHHDHAAVAGGPVIPIRSHPADGRPGPATVGAAGAAGIGTAAGRSAGTRGGPSSNLCNASETFASVAATSGPF